MITLENYNGFVKELDPAQTTLYNNLIKYLNVIDCPLNDMAIQYLALRTVLSNEILNFPKTNTQSELFTEALAFIQIHIFKILSNLDTNVNTSEKDSIDILNSCSGRISTDIVYLRDHSDSVIIKDYINFMSKSKPSVSTSPATP